MIFHYYVTSVGLTYHNTYGFVCVYSLNMCMYAFDYICVYIIGLLAGMWPCGTITLIDELFTSESISQVYGCLHGFIHTNSTNTENIGIYKI